VIALRRATAADADRLLEWRNDPATRAASFSTGEVDRDTHLAWLERRLADPMTVLNVLTVDGEPAGQLRLELAPDGSAEVSIGLAPAVRGRGLAAPALGLIEPLAREHGAGRLIAKVRPTNEPSLRAFRRAGYEESERTDDTVTFERPL
jgi:RimJ/RimL family protein N-acetyltransferase